MLDLVKKRHEGDGWIVFSELANASGHRATRYADAMALGVWASTKYEAHLYEFKISREDLKKELRDPTKADGVGKFCHFWWLVVADEKLLDGLVIPQAWGILTPSTRGGSKILKVVRKAPRLKATPFNELFSIATIRNIHKHWVPKEEHNKLREDGFAALRDEVRLELKHEADDARRELRELKASVEAFERASGVTIGRSWEAGKIGAAVKTVLELRGQLLSPRDVTPIDMLRAEEERIRQSIDRHEGGVSQLKWLLSDLRSRLSVLELEDLARRGERQTAETPSTEEEPCATAS